MAENGFIAEHNAFYRRLRNSPLSPNAQALWNYLLSRINANYWQQPISIRNDQFTGDMNISKTSLARARDELVEAGLLLYEPAGGRRASAYSLPSVCQPGQIMRQRANIREIIEESLRKGGA